MDESNSITNVIEIKEDELYLISINSFESNIYAHI